MEERDLELIEQHRKTNYELDKLYQDHVKLDAEVDKLELQRVLTPEDEKKLATMKREKLDGRDQIENILKTLR